MTRSAAPSCTSRARRLGFAPRCSFACLTAAVALAAPFAAQAQTELHFLYGSHTNPFAATSTGTVVVTVQHASMWSYGDNFLFIDFLDDGDPDGFNDADFYGEWHSNFSLGRIAGRDLGFGPIADFGVTTGFAIGADSDFQQWLPAARIAWNVPGFVFLNSDFAYAMDIGGGLDAGGLPKVDDRMITTLAWLAPFRLGAQSFSFTGFAEHHTATRNELGDDVPFAILMQPQLRWDVGGADGLMLGVEHQMWINKLGSQEDENVLQLMAVWVM